MHTKCRYSILICEDNREFAQQIRNEIYRIASSASKYELDVYIGIDTTDMIRCIESGKYDLAVLDVCINESTSTQTYANYMRGRTFSQYYGPGLYKRILECSSHTKVFAISNLNSTYTRPLFDYDSRIEYFYKKDKRIDESVIAQHIVNYFDTEMKRVLNNVFIVYGHNEKMHSSVSNYIRTLDINSLDLFNDSRSGISSVFDRLDDCASKAECAIVLLSGDDKAITYDEEIDREVLTYRARQNVIFEMGLFAGLLRRNKVIVIYEVKPGFEIPSDIKGIFYIPFDKKGKWKEQLKVELDKIGFCLS